MLKAIQSHPPEVNSIPHQSNVAHRLAQCLNPSLPSGVHQRALEVYAFIFTLLGPSNLVHDYSVFLPGLSPVLTFASLTLRPAYFTLIEKHIIALDPKALRPALRALLLCLLPGLEEESSEEFDRTLSILDKLKGHLNPNPPGSDIQAKGFGDEHFWQCLFLASTGSRSRRQGALAYMSKRLPRLVPVDQERQAKVEDIVANVSSAELAPYAESVISPEPGLLIRSFATGLEDEQVLIQRGYLDLLVTHLPLHSPVLTSRVDVADLQQLVSAAISVVSRRDMSLNRRLWTWFIGPQNMPSGGDSNELVSPIEEIASLSDPKQRQASRYFEAFGLTSVTSSVLSMFGNSLDHPAAKARPFRTCLSLMDRREIGGMIIRPIFEPAMDQLLTYSRTATPEQFKDVMRSANSFFDGIQSGVIWEQLVRLAKTALTDHETSAASKKRRLELILFVVSQFNIREEEMMAFHIPMFMVLVTILLIKAVSSSQGVNDVAQKCLEVVTNIQEKLVTIMPERLSLNDTFTQENSSTADQWEDDTRVVDRIYSFYAENEGSPVSLIEACSRTFSILLKKVPDTSALDHEAILTSVNHTIESEPLTSHHNKFATYKNASEVLAQLFNSRAPTRAVSASLRFQSLVHALTAKLWSFLTPDRPKYHVETVKAVWQLNDLLPSESLVEAAVADRIVHAPSNETQLIEVQRFTVLWSHTVLPSSISNKNYALNGSIASQSTAQQDSRSHQTMLHRPLLLLLQHLDQPDTEIAWFTRNWLSGLHSLPNIVDLVLNSISVPPQDKLEAQRSDHHHTQFSHQRKDAERLHFLRILDRLLNLPGRAIWIALSATSSSGSEEQNSDTENIRLDARIIRCCLEIIQAQRSIGEGSAFMTSRASLSILERLSDRSSASTFVEARCVETLIDALLHHLKEKHANPMMTVSLLSTISMQLQLGATGEAHKYSRSEEKQLRQSDTTERAVPPLQLFKCIEAGIAAPSSLMVLDHWTHFVIDVLPLYSETLFQNMIALVESFCKAINTQFVMLQKVYQSQEAPDLKSSDTALIALLEGLEHVVAAAHDRLAAQESKSPSVRSPEPAQGFFGNVLSGVISGEHHRNRSSLANSRLTVLLCFQDSVRICYSIWAWGSRKDALILQDPASSASFSHVAMRLRSKARRMLDRMFTVEPLECLETMVVEWVSERGDASTSAPLPMTLLHVLAHSRPKAVVPALFNAIYSRTNPSALDAARTSSLTSDIAVVDLARFLVAYTETLEDDAMDEIWQDCISFLRDVLTNPLPQSQMLPLLLRFILVLAKKSDNTNFGDPRKMRRDLSDLFLRILSATFTTRSAGSLHEPASAFVDGRPTSNGESPGPARPPKRREKNVNLFEILNSVVPQLQTILGDTERISNAASVISSNTINPILHAKAFPSNLRPSQLELFEHLAKLSVPSKTLKKELADFIGAPRLFSIPPALASPFVLPIIRQATVADKDRLPDLIGRLQAPASAGIVFGVGATAARLDADKKTQLNLRRLAMTILAMDVDHVVTHYSQLNVKLDELLGATPSSSPSSMTRAEIFMVLRAVVLQTTSTHLASFWPMVTLELQKALTSALPGASDYDTYNVASLLQACKLLDLLLVVAPDDFQLYQWLFVTDTIDAVYRPADFEPIGLADEMADDLGAGIAAEATAAAAAAAAAATPVTPTTASGELAVSAAAAGRKAKRVTLLDEMLRRRGQKPGGMGKDECVTQVLRPWFAQLSIHAYEATYSLEEADVGACREALVSDLFDDSTLVG